jgi:hypothetical protein
MLTEIYIEALLANEELADQVWEEMRANGSLYDIVNRRIRFAGAVYDEYESSATSIQRPTGVRV